MRDCGGTENTCLLTIILIIISFRSTNFRPFYPSRPVIFFPDMHRNAVWGLLSVYPCLLLSAFTPHLSPIPPSLLSIPQMSYMLPHLRSGWAVDQAILNEESKVVVIRFGHDENETCMQMDEVLYKISEDVRNFAAIYLVDTSEVSSPSLLPGSRKKIWVHSTPN